MTTYVITVPERHKKADRRLTVASPHYAVKTMHTVDE